MEQLYAAMVQAIEKIADWVIGFGKEVLIFTNGLLVGLWNSLIEILRGVFDLLALIFRLGQSDEDVNLTDMGLLASQLQMLVETLENGLDWFTNLFTAATGAKLLAFYIRMNQTIVTSIMNVNADRAGYLLGFIIGIVVEELLDAFFTGGIKNVADIARYLKKSVDSALNTIQDLGDATARVFHKARSKAGKAASSAMNLMRSINRMLRSTMNPEGLQDFLDLILTQFEEFILGIKVDLLVKGQQRLGGAVYSNIPIDELGKLLGRIFKAAELKKMSRLGIKVVRDTKDRTKFLVQSSVSNQVDSLLMNTRELDKFIEELINVAERDLPQFFKRYSSLQLKKNLLAKSFIIAGDSNLKRSIENVNLQVAKLSDSLELDSKWRQAYRKKRLKSTLKVYLKRRKVLFINRKVGAITEEIVRKAKNASKSNKADKTPFTYRYLDGVVNEVLGIEVKSGNFRFRFTKNGDPDFRTSLAKQWKKDTYLLGVSYENIEWHIFGKIDDRTIKWIEKSKNKIKIIIYDI